MEIFFYDAIQQAMKFDEQYNLKSCGKSLSPLFGLPVSLKDYFQVPGYDTPTGLCF